MTEPHGLIITSDISYGEVFRLDYVSELVWILTWSFSVFAGRYLKWDITSHSLTYSSMVFISFVLPEDTTGLV
jgi:hypothetical protein